MEAEDWKFKLDMHLARSSIAREFVNHILKGLPLHEPLEILNETLQGEVSRARSTIG